MLEDVISDVKDIKDDIYAIRLEIEKSKTAARVAWLAFTFFIGIAGYSLRDYVSNTVNRIDKIEAVTVQNNQNIALVNVRLNTMDQKLSSR